MTAHDDSDERLPLLHRSLLGGAVGRALLDVTRGLTSLAAHREFGGSVTDYFARASGPTEMTFSDGLIHTFVPWPSELSVLVSGATLPEDPYAERHRLSASPSYAPPWLTACLGARVTAVRVHVFEDDVPSEEARQAAVSYALDNGTELFYCTQLHGRMSGDELLRREDLPDVLPAYTIDVAATGRGPA